MSRASSPPTKGCVKLLGNATLDLAYLPQDAGVRSGRSLWEELLSSFPELQQAQIELAAVEVGIGDAATAGDDDRLQELIDRQGALLERFEQLDGYRVEAEIAKVLAGLGFASTDRDKPCDAFSGGWQMRIALAKMLVRKPGLLLLDEPTNHLDLAASEWLEELPARVPGADRGRLARPLLPRPRGQPHPRARGRRGSSTIAATTATTWPSASGSARSATAYERQQKYIKRQMAFINASAPTPRAPRWSRAASGRWPSSSACSRRAPEPRRSRSGFATGQRSAGRVLTAEGLTKAYGGRDVIAGLVAGDQARRPDRAGRPERRRQVHAAADCWPGSRQPDAGTIVVGRT